MITSTVISFVFSLFFLGIPSDASVVLPENNEPSIGIVRGAVEKITQFPEAVNNSINKNRLPENLDKKIFPSRKKDSQSFSLPISSGIVIDKETEIPLWDQKAQEVSSIASITKLMTALVFLENNPGWNTVYKIKKKDRREGGKIYINTDEEVRVKDLFYLSLVSSANTATVALVSSTGLSEAEFIKRMNKKAEDLGLKKTNFADPVGLSRWNVSTAYEIAKIAKEAFSFEDIKNVLQKKEYSFKTIDNREIKIESTDSLLEVFPVNGINLISGKTGFTNSAGFCFVGNFIDSNNKEVISVVLGSDTIENRFNHTKDLVEWVFDSYLW